MLPDQKFRFLAEEVKKRSGLILGADKGYLVDSRLSPLARTEGYNSVEALVDAMMRGDQRLCISAAEALATHETFFFRDKTPFETFENTIIPSLKSDVVGRKAKIWCAACSTGQEPYSLSMILNDTPGIDAEIFATDMCDSVLEKARTGLYSQFEVQRGLAVQKLVAHFEQVGDLWRIKPHIREKVTYQVGNLLDDFTTYGKKDVIFCRNVLIYFNIEAKAKILERLAHQLNPTGFLILGAAETVVGLTDALRPIPGERGLYAKPEYFEQKKAAVA